MDKKECKNVKLHYCTESYDEKRVIDSINLSYIKQEDYLQNQVDLNQNQVDLNQNQVDLNQKK
ncbi:hypothetical protein [Campylobacter sp. RKI_CA19_01127]|uniref:hypothetical protein n=1 Tax=Campylobacter sp. RKI_CA19_01127 TaxID=2911628 RepID=UPI0021E99631|nr:hypothetical protein [Campylobacter sp. RKI_CA19_01127]MCV3349817.1 hypothetical protein [Campylobacter sp. RKI_CA19_01127]